MTDIKKAVGKRGSWFANIDGHSFPCVHKYWITGLQHHDQFRYRGSEIETKVAELVEAVRNGKRVILTNDTPLFDSNCELSGFERTSYIALYAVEDVTYSPEDGLRFRLSDRICNLR